MGSSRKRRRASQRRLARLSQRRPLTVWAIIGIALVILALGIARTFT